MNSAHGTENPTNKCSKKTRFCGCFRNQVELKQVEMDKNISTFHNSISAPNFKWWFFGDLPFTREPLFINKNLVYLNLKLRYWSLLRGSSPFSACEINFRTVMKKKPLRNAAWLIWIGKYMAYEIIPKHNWGYWVVFPSGESRCSCAHYTHATLTPNGGSCLKTYTMSSICIPYTSPPKN